MRYAVPTHGSSSRLTLRHALLLLLLMMTAPSTFAAQPIAATSTPTSVSIAPKPYSHKPQDALSRDILRSIFTMRLSAWPDGSRIQVLVLPDDNPLHRQFSKNVLGLFPYQLRRVWDQGVFSGTGEAPTEVESIESMRTLLQQTPGAIGYLPEQPDQQGVYRVEFP